MPPQLKLIKGETTMVKLIKCQQQILKELGLYQGIVDGSWGLKSQSAMAGFQLSAVCAGMPIRSDNQPFAPFETLPKGWAWSEDGEGICVEFSERKVEEPTTTTTTAAPIIPEVTTTTSAPEPTTTTTAAPVVVEPASTVVVPVTDGSISAIRTEAKFKK
jgi:hypothetical protein